MSDVKIDGFDLKILRALQSDARKSYRDIANELNVAVGTVYNRIKKLMDKGVLKGYTVVLDPSRLGYDLTALILIQVDGAHLVEVENELAKFKDTVAVYDITGEFDVAVIAKFKTRDALNKFVKNILKIPYIKRTSTSVVLNVVKEPPIQLSV
ncbi:MAG: Lrp/AsnC family transcriptional regulator [Candidatus Nezhaarchaeales archaeon]